MTKEKASSVKQTRSRWNNKRPRRIKPLSRYYRIASRFEKKTKQSIRKQKSRIRNPDCLRVKRNDLKINNLSTSVVNRGIYKADMNNSERILEKIEMEAKSNDDTSKNIKRKAESKEGGVVYSMIVIP